MAAHPGWAFCKTADQVGPRLQNPGTDGRALLADGLSISSPALDRGLQHRHAVSPLIEVTEGVLDDQTHITVDVADSAGPMRPLIT
jgi:hypothetical protein